MWFPIPNMKSFCQFLTKTSLLLEKLDTEHLKIENQFENWKLKQNYILDKNLFLSIYN